MKIERFLLADLATSGDYAASRSHRIYLVLRGTLWVDVASENRRTPAVRIFYVSPGLLHRCQAKDVEVEVLRLEFSPTEWNQKARRKFEFMMLSPSQLLRELILGLRLRRPKAERRALADAALVLLLRELGEQCHPAPHSFKPLEHHLRDGLDERVERALRRLLELDKVPTLSVADLAKAARVSERQLHRLFHSELGLVPVRAIRQAKIERALQLLRHTSQPMTRISENAGFGSLAQFNSSFRKMIDQSPLQYRKSQS